MIQRHGSSGEEISIHPSPGTSRPRSPTWAGFPTEHDGGQVEPDGWTESRTGAGALPSMLRICQKPDTEEPVVARAETAAPTSCPPGRRSEGPSYRMDGKGCGESPCFLMMRPLPSFPRDTRSASTSDAAISRIGQISSLCGRFSSWIMPRARAYPVFPAGCRIQADAASEGNTAPG
jgi:hypothetical protein